MSVAHMSVLIPRKESTRVFQAPQPTLISARAFAVSSHNVVAADG